MRDVIPHVLEWPRIVVAVHLGGAGTFDGVFILRGRFFFARFAPGVLFFCWTVAGAMGLSFSPFFLNVLGATLYVPAAVAMGIGLSDFAALPEKSNIASWRQRYL